jgi:hypothetical protein
MNKLAFFVTFIVFIISSVSQDVDAQVRKRTTTKRKSKEKKESINLMEKINPELKLGNLIFSNGFNASLKANVGYKLSQRFTVGLGGRLFYEQYPRIGPDVTFTDYGGFLFGRGKITEEIYVQAEYASTKYRDRSTSGTINQTYPLFGLGYSSGYGKWKYGVELLYIANQKAQDLQYNVVEYWFGVSYNF